MKAAFLSPAVRKSSRLSKLHCFAAGVTLLGTVSLFSPTVRAEIVIAPDFPVGSSKGQSSSKKDAATELLDSYRRDMQRENPGTPTDSSPHREFKVSLAR